MISTPLQSDQSMSLKTPCRTGMATFANRKIVTAKRALAVVTSHTTLSAAGRMVIGGFRRCYLAALRQTRLNLMTLVTV
jgi:hypothetical protein